MTLSTRPSTPRLRGGLLRGGLLAVLLLSCASCRRSVDSDVDGSSPAVQGPDIQAQRLASALPGEGDRLFVKLPPESSGIDFVHDWVSPDDYPHDLETMMAGGGVAIGDYDADGLPDVYLARPQGGNRLYRNLGQLRFADVTDSIGLGQQGFWGGGVSFVDIDNDGDLDLYACGHGYPNRLYVNQGDGTFDEQAQRMGLDFKGASVMMSFADYDRDGDLDGYLLTNHLPPPSEVSEVNAALVNGRRVVPDRFHEYRDVLTHPDGSPVPVRGASSIIFSAMKVRTERAKFDLSMSVRLRALRAIIMASRPLGGTTTRMDCRICTWRMILRIPTICTATMATARSPIVCQRLCRILPGSRWALTWPMSTTTVDWICWPRTWQAHRITNRKSAWAICRRDCGFWTFRHRGNTCVTRCT